MEPLFKYEANLKGHGESIIGVSSMGLNKVLDVTFNDKDKIVQFESEVTALGIVR